MTPKQVVVVAGKAALCAAIGAGVVAGMVWLGFKLHWVFTILEWL